MAEKTKKKQSVKTKGSIKKVENKKGLSRGVKRKISDLSERRKAFLARRPHRSFRLTKRRDYKRSLKLPGYWLLTLGVFRVLFRNKKTFLSLALLYSFLMLLLASVMSQDAYSQIRNVVDGANEDGFFGDVIPTLAIFWEVFTGQIAGAASGSAGSSQQIIGGLLGLFTWLSTIWLLRGVMAGKKPKMRDGVYSSGGPVVALFVLVVIILIQLLPAALAIILYGAADTSGLLSQTAVLMLFGGGAVLLITLSLYWATSTFFAMIIVALPGMYPMRALKLAGDLVVGRRIRVLLRLLWLIVLLVVVWAAVLIPIILIDSALKSSIPALSWLPLVPISALFLMTFSIIISASYIYIFYRKVVEDDAVPA